MITDLIQFAGQWVVFTPDELTQISARFRSVRLRKGEHLLRAGHVCDRIWFIRRGVLRIYFQQGTDEVTRYLGIDGSFITSLASFVNRRPAHEHIEALEDCELLVVEYGAMMDLCARLHAWETLYRNVIEYMFTCSEDRIREFITLTAQERYFNLLRTRPQLLRRVSQKHIASYIGISPTSLSRLQRLAYQRQKEAVTN